MESRRHTQFARDRFGTTEWFRLSDAMRAHLDVLHGGAGDPWRLHARWVSEAVALRG